ncbi:hypothetical protein J7M28_00070, partial [bacterium]|nr:hypothetical protein [bacterium]
MKDDLVNGRRLLSGAVFDADGDRFFRLDYSPFDDAIIASSGDEAAYIQAQYMAENVPGGAQPRFIHTVESDINVGNFAAQQLGVRPVMTAVGDKWVLFEAFVSQLLGRLSLIEQRLGQDAPHGVLERASSIRDRLNSIMDERSSDSEVYLSIEDEIYSMQRDYLTPDQLESVNRGLIRQGAIPYLVGFEETGHSITAGILAVHGDSRSGQMPNPPSHKAGDNQTTNDILFFAGNGLKSAINTLVASQMYLAPSLDVEKFQERLASPFPRGFKRTYYAYYTMKESFVEGIAIWEEFAQFLEQECRYRFAADFDVSRREFAEDRDMVFIAITSKGGSEVAASVFARNSGTEEKTGINVRGPSDLAERLDAVGDLGRRRLLTTLKSSESMYAKAEKLLLNALHETDDDKSILLADAIAMVSRTFPDVVPDRLLLEMHKQELIELESLGDPSAEIRISPLGTWHIL